jgi:multidrug efflux pump subunit AcrA (membrane-fusion protein)
MTKYILIALAATVVIGIITLASPSRQWVAAPPTIATEPPATIYATGVIKGASESIDLRTEAGGRIARILVHEGQWVKT